MTALQWLLLPAFIHVALVIVQSVRMLRGRIAAVRRRDTTLAAVRRGDAAWPEPVRLLADSYANQFELPVLFYAALALIAATGLADLVAIVLAWGFVLSRIVHAVIHTGSNVILRRLRAFMAGVLLLIALWLWFGLRLYITG